MGKIKDLFRRSRQLRGQGAAGQRYLSTATTGITPSNNPATGDVGPDAPRPDRPDRPRRPGPRGRNRRLGGDVRTPLAP